jgi:hypothetical protein
MKTTIPSQLSDAELVSEVMRFARCERDATSHLVAHLAEFDARKLYLGAGFSSLFMYCREVLELSESESYNRIEAARATRRFPLILNMLRDGSVNLTTVRLLAPHLTGENHQELLAAAARRSKREVEELVVRHSPRPDIPSSVRKVPVAKPIPVPSPGLPIATPASVTPVGAPGNGPMNGSAPLPPVPPSRPHRPNVTPLAPDRYEIRFTANAAVCQKLRLATDLLRHVVPTGDTAEIVDRALTALLEDLARKKFAATGKPRPNRGTAPGSRHIPAQVKRAVWIRDGGRCAFTSKGGRRCAERGFLEFHHLKPYAVGGEATVDNIEVRCRAHNAYEAELFYGPCNGGEGVARESGGIYWPYAERQLVPERVGLETKASRGLQAPEPPPSA